MSRSADRRHALVPAAAVAALLGGAVWAQGDGSSEPSPVAPREGGFGLGRPALPEEVAAWNIDIRPDGQGLPVGSGDVMAGEEVYLSYCSTCHGDFGEGAGRWPVLMGGDGTLAGADPVKTVGSYWPYLSTVWDYVHRAMPFGAAQTLTDDEVYAVTAYILYLNDLVDDDFVLSNETFAAVEMPNEGNFFPDDRPEAELAAFAGEPCMSDCTDGPVEVTARAQVIDVTPDDEARRRAVEAEAAASEEQGSNLVESAAEIGTEAGAGGEEDQATDTARTVPVPEAEEEVPEVEVAAAAAPDPELVAAGERLFRRCASCHKVGEGAKNAVGPHLNDVMGRMVGAVEDYRYSAVFEEYHDEGRVWDEAAMSAFLEDPRGWAPGTKMSFRGLAKPEDRDAISAYLLSLGG